MSRDDTDPDLVETMMITKMTWLPPVEKAAELPIEGVEEGTMCLVEDADDIYEFRAGEWVVSARI